MKKKTTEKKLLKLKKSPIMKLDERQMKALIGGYDLKSTMGNTNSSTKVGCTGD